MIVEQSQLYAQQNGRNFIIDVSELKAFIGIIIRMSLVKLPNIRLYWSTDPTFAQLQIASIMTRDRFEQILRNLHFTDNEEALDSRDPEYDRAYKIRPVLNHINEVMPKAYNYRKRLSIDEHMVKFKGKNAMKQYMKDKPVSWGFKLWCLCESNTGFLYNVDIYTGKKAFVQHGLGESVVLKLAAPLPSKGIELYFDNFFTSLKLLDILKQNDIMACGTIRSNRKYMPKNFIPDKSMKRGDISHFTSEGISVVKWLDNRAVFAATNFLDPDGTFIVKRRQAGQANKISVNCPSIIQHYNKGMGGVDLMDQKKVYYEYDRRSKWRYYLRLFFDLFEICVHNSFIVFTSLNSETCNVTSLEFRASLASELIAEFSSRKYRLSDVKKSGPNSLIKPKCVHNMEKVSSWKRCVYCSRNDKSYKRTNVYCKECNVFLCFTTQRNCFANYHRST